jgi:HSP20 family protein
MPIVTWSPFRELDPIQQRMRSILQEVGFAPTIPAADIYETDKEFVVELEVPGYEETELAVHVTDHTLTVTGEQLARTEREERTFRLKERMQTEFERRFQLPEEVDSTHLKATFKEGVLEVHAPKQAAPEPAVVPIAKA